MSKSTDTSKCSCLSDDADMVNYSEAEHILQDIKTDLKAIQQEIKTDFSKSCPTERACKVSSVLVKLQSADSRLHQIMKIMQSAKPQETDDLSSNFGMTVKLDMVRKKLSDLKEKHDKLSKEWHSQEQHLNKIAEAVAKKENELKFQSVFCTTQGFVLSKMLWKSSKCDCLLELMITQEKLILELIKTLDGCLYAFSRTYQKEMPEPTADEYQYVLCLCGVLSNLASIPDGRFFLISQPVCRDVYDQIIKMLPRILVPKAESLKWIMLVAIYNIMICKEGREYAKSNRYLLQSLSRCIKPPHSNKIIILALKIIGNLTNDSNKAYIAHLNNILPLERLSQLQQSKDSCTIRKQATQILNNMTTEKLLHTIQIEESKSRCNAACTQTFPKKNQDLLAYYVFTDTTNTLTSAYTSSFTTTSGSSFTESNDGTDYDSSDSTKSEFESSESKYRQKMETATSSPVPSYNPQAKRDHLRSISAYNTGYLSPLEDPSRSPRYMTDVSNDPLYGEDLPESLSPSSISKEVRNNQTPLSTVTPVSTYVDSGMLEPLSSTNNISPYGRIEDSPESVYDSASPVSTYVDSGMLSPVSSSNNKGSIIRFTEPMVQLTPRNSRESTASPVSYPSTCDDPSMIPTSSKQLKSSYPVNVQFNQKPSALCRPSIWSIPAQPIPNNTFQEPTPSRSQEFDLLQRQPPQMDINKLLSITIGDNLQNPSLTRKNAGNNTTPDTDSNPSIITMFRISDSKTYLSPESSSTPFGNPVATNTSFALSAAVEDFFRNRNKNIGTSPKSSKKRVSLDIRESKDAAHAGYGGYNSFYEKLKKDSFSRKSVKFENIGTSPKPSIKYVPDDFLVSKDIDFGKFDSACSGYKSFYERLKKDSFTLLKSANIKKHHPQINYEDFNMPSTSTGYYGYETLNPFAIYPDPSVSNSSLLEPKKENKGKEKKEEKEDEKKEDKKGDKKDQKKDKEEEKKDDKKESKKETKREEKRDEKKQERKEEKKEDRREEKREEKREGKTDDKGEEKEEKKREENTQSYSKEIRQVKRNCSKPQDTLGNIPESKKYRACSPEQSSWKCHVSRAKRKPKKKPLFTVYNVCRKRKW